MANSTPAHLPFLDIRHKDIQTPSPDRKLKGKSQSQQNLIGKCPETTSGQG